MVAHTVPSTLNILREKHKQFESGNIKSRNEYIINSSGIKIETENIDKDEKGTGEESVNKSMQAFQCQVA